MCYFKGVEIQYASHEQRTLMNTKFKIVYDFYRGYNYMKPDGTFLCNEWFETTYPFDGNIAEVQNNHKSNFINTEGELIFDTWFDDVIDLRGVKLYSAMVSNKGYRIINRDGKYISDEFYMDVQQLRSKLTLVQRNDKKYNLFASYGKLCLNEWVTDIWRFYDYNGISLCKIYSSDKGWNYLTSEGTLFFDTWFKFVDESKCTNFKVIKINDKLFWVDLEGGLRPYNIFY